MNWRTAAWAWFGTPVDRLECRKIDDTRWYLAKVADQYLVVDPWKIIEDGFHPERSRVSESLFSLGNEYMGVRGYFDEGYSGKTLIGCYLNGINEEYFLKEPSGYKGMSNRICFMVNTIDWLYTRLELDGDTLDLNRSQISEFKRELDFRTGELRRGFVWKTHSGKEVKVAFGRFLSMTTPELGFQRITLTPLNFSGSITVTMGVDASIDHETYRSNFWDCPRKQARDGVYSILSISKGLHNKLFAGFRVQNNSIVDSKFIVDDKFIGARFPLNLTQGDTMTTDKQVVVTRSYNGGQTAEPVWQEGLARIGGLKYLSYDEACWNNVTYWQKFWERFDIPIEGDLDTQQGIRFSIFQLQQTYRGTVHGSNIGAKGLTGEFYNGNAFWDTETYCLPYYIFSNPAAAKALIEFRYLTLPQAVERARQLDCDGACFPVATCDGTESCTLWQHASLQIQPTTAVAYAIWHYVKVTEDVEFLYGKGIELLIHICRFLASRGQWSPRNNKFGYYAVMGPDEFQMMVNNNSYTNYMAQQTFRYALKALDEMETGSPERKSALLQSLAIQPVEFEDWKAMADNMLLLYDPETKLFEQHAGFFDLPHVDVDAIPEEDFPLYHHWAYDRIYRNDMIKQPDVLMFMFLHNQSFSLEQKRANYDYYEPRCIHESSLSPSVHSIFAAELGRPAEAFEFFKFDTRIDLDNYNNNTDEGVHITSIAAAWMNIVYGFGGMRSDGDMLVFNPTIPAHWKSYSFQILYRNSLLRVTVSQDQTCIRVVEGPIVRVKINNHICEIGIEGLRL